MHLKRKFMRVLMFIAALSAPVSASEPRLVAVEEDTGELFSVSTTDATLTSIGSTVPHLGALELNPQDGVLYGLTTGENATLYRLDISSTWDDVQVSAIDSSSNGLGLSIFEGGLAFAPDGTAFGLNGGGPAPQLFTVDLTTGLATVLGTLRGRFDFAGLGWRGDGVGGGTLVALDSTSNSLLTIDTFADSFGFIQTGFIKDLDPILGSVGGMVLIEDDFGYFTTGGPNALSPGSNELYSFDPFTGDIALIGDFNATVSGTGISGLAYVPEPATLGLLAFAAVALLRRRDVVK